MPPPCCCCCGWPVRGRRRTPRRQFVERQIGHDALAGRAAVIDQLFGAVEDALHGLEIDALARHVLGLGIFVIDLEEAGALAARLGDRLLLVAFGNLQNLRGASLGVRNDAVGIGLRLVLQPLEVGARRLHVAEGVDDLRGRIDLLHLHLGDLDARAVTVERLLHQLLHALLGGGAGAGQDRLDVGLADDLAHRAFGHRLHGAFGILDVEEEVGRALRLDAPQHGEVDVDDVLVAGQHQAFLRHVAHGAAAPRGIVDQGHADGNGGDAQRLRQQHGLDRIRQVIVQAGLGVADIFAEAQHDAELFRLHAIEAGHAPDRDRADHDQRNAEPGEIAAGQQLLQPVLTAPQEILEIGRPWADRLRTGAPWSFRTRTPRAPALILPRHETLLLRRGLGACEAGLQTWQPYKGGVRPLQRRHSG